MGMRGLQRLTHHVQENLRPWGREGHKKGDKPGHCTNHGKEMQIIHSVEVPGVPVETRWCIGAFH